MKEDIPRFGLDGSFFFLPRFLDAFFCFPFGILKDKTTICGYSSKNRVDIQMKCRDFENGREAARSRYPEATVVDVRGLKEYYLER